MFDFIKKSGQPPGILNTLKNVQFCVCTVHNKILQTKMCIYTSAFFEDVSPGNTCQLDGPITTKLFSNGIGVVNCEIRGPKIDRFLTGE